MRATLALLLCCCLGACDVVGQARGACQALLDQELPKFEAEVWAQCTDYYQTTVIPQLQAAIQKAEADIAQSVDRACCDRINSLHCHLTDVGTWTCLGAPVCL